MHFFCRIRMFLAGSVAVLLIPITAVNLFLTYVMIFLIDTYLQLTEEGKLAPSLVPVIDRMKLQVLRARGECPRCFGNENEAQ